MFCDFSLDGFSVHHRRMSAARGECRPSAPQRREGEIVRALAAKTSIGRRSPLVVLAR